LVSLLFALHCGLPSQICGNTAAQAAAAQCFSIAVADVSSFTESSDLRCASLFASLINIQRQSANPIPAQIKSRFKDGPDDVVEPKTFEPNDPIIAPANDSRVLSSPFVILLPTDIIVLHFSSNYDQ
jgi:hypothetical protein